MRAAGASDRDIRDALTPYISQAIRALNTGANRGTVMAASDQIAARASQQSLGQAVQAGQQGLQNQGQIVQGMSGLADATAEWRRTADATYAGGWQPMAFVKWLNSSRGKANGANGHRPNPNVQQRALPGEYQWKMPIEQ